VTDWILVELQDTNGIASVGKSAPLGCDGRALSADGATGVVTEVSAGARLYLVVKHRSHLISRSAQPLVFTNILTPYDFTTGPDKHSGGTNACVELEPGVWGLIAGDADGDGKITETDREIVKRQMGKKGYLSGDVNLDGIVDGND
jgi:hypothetical protein